MAFHWQTFRTRALTAILFVVVMGAGLLYSRWSFFALFSIIHFGAWVEYNRIVLRINPDYAAMSAVSKVAFALGGWCLLLYFTQYELQVGGISLRDMGFWLGALSLVLLPVLMLLQRKGAFLHNVGWTVIGLFYISLPLGLMIFLRNYWTDESSHLSFTIPLLVIFSIWINDTMAYIVGSLIGKTPLSPISPKKTWEGTIGGALLAVVVLCILAYYTERLSLMHTAIITALAATAGTIGDLFESKLKRMAGVKDSGTFMPGHGGFLDRFDSLLFAVVVVWFYAVLFL